MVKTAAGIVASRAPARPSRGVGLAQPAPWRRKRAPRGAAGRSRPAPTPTITLRVGERRRLGGSRVRAAAGGGATRTGAGSGGGGGGGYFGGGGGASGDAELSPAPTRRSARTRAGRAGAAGSNFVAASTPLLGARAARAGRSAVRDDRAGDRDQRAGERASFAVGQKVSVAWSCSGTAQSASGQDVSCTAPTPSGGRLDTKSAGVHSFTVSDGGTIVARVTYAVTPACATRKAGALGRCLAQSAYFKALARCGGTGRAAAACSSAAKRSYTRSLAKTK